MPLEIKFWEMFSVPGTYDILTEYQYKLPNSNDGCMRLRAPTTCPKWNEGMDKDIIILHWLSKNAGLTSECITEGIEPFSRQRLENVTTGMMWNEAAKHAATKQVMQPLPHPLKAAEPTTAPLHSGFDQLLEPWLGPTYFLFCLHFPYMDSLIVCPN